MRFASRRRAEGAIVLLVALSARGVFAQEPAIDDYPSDITPPRGTQYPCVLTPLPRGLPGVLEADRAYVNRAYARILKATQAKLVLLKALEGGPKSGFEPALAKYREVMGGIEERERGDVLPNGLDPFRADLLAAYALQRSSFDKAVVARADGATMAAVLAIPEARQASGRLIAAWSRMQARYPSWPTETRDSIYHHLCALDLF